MTILLNPVCGACDCTGTTYGRLYVGGSFTTLMGVSCTYLAMLSVKPQPVTLLAHISATFLPVLDSKVLAIGIDEANGRVWIGGDFTTVNGTSAVSLAVLDWNTGAIALTPTVLGGTSGTRVNAITIDPVGGFAYVGGVFTKVGGITQNRFARFSLTTGAWDPSFFMNINDQVRNVRQLGSALYLAGDFSVISGSTRRGFAKVSTAAVMDPAFNPNVFSGTFPSTGFDVLPVDASHVYITGDFDYINGSSTGGGVNRPVVAMVDGNGTDQGWDPMNATPLFPSGFKGYLALGTVPTLTDLMQPVLVTNAELLGSGATIPLLALNQPPPTAGSKLWSALGDGGTDPVACDNQSRAYTGVTGTTGGVSGYDQTTGLPLSDWIVTSDGVAQALAFTAMAFPG